MSSADRVAAKRPVVMIRNGVKLCAACRDNGCDRNISGPSMEQEYVSDEPCECCELDFEVNDGFGI